MVRHFVILSSSYSEGKRIAMHYVMDDGISADMIQDEIKKIKEICGETVSISTHCLVTDSREWISVVEKDGFFEDVHKVETLTEFVGLIKQDRELRGLDVAKYILSKIKCSHLKLEKLVYLCYADYLCARNGKLYTDKIYAYRYGPVVDSVYEEYKGTRDELYEEVNDEYERMPIRSRILFAYDGIEKLAAIDRTIEKYSEMSTSDLVNLTHTKRGPWDCVYDKGYNTEIKDEIILKRHKYEIQ